MLRLQNVKCFVVKPVGIYIGRSLINEAENYEYSSRYRVGESNYIFLLTYEREKDVSTLDLFFAKSCIYLSRLSVISILICKQSNNILFKRSKYRQNIV